MRWNDLNGGSIRTLLILILLVANIAATLPRISGSAGASPAVSRASRDTPLREELFGEAPKTAREARALPGEPPR